MIRRHLAPALIVLALAVGCSSGGSDSSASTSTTTSSPSTTAASSTSTKVPGHCASAQLQASLGPADAGAGQLYTPLVLVNIGGTPCTLRGFPGVSLLDQTETEIGQPASREGAEGGTVTLAANGSASAVLQTANGANGSATCTPASTFIRVYPPDNTQAIVIRAQYTACGGFSVGTLVPGATGR
ncbi:MAG: DUF4232 domain-containing protein [Acidobacteria bacterium]|nr:DUF4232 domain-containing protein [Acidobacteriota bacterium]